MAGRESAGEDLTREVQERAIEKLMMLIELGADPTAVKALLSKEARTITQMMSPAEKARRVFPTAKLVPFDQVPAEVVQDLLQTHTMAELKRGTFFVPKADEQDYYFVMDQPTGERMEQEGQA